MKYGAYSSFNNAQSAYDNMLPPDTFDPGEYLPSAAEMADKYTAAALREMHGELDAEELAATTPEEITEWALGIAAEHGERWQQPLKFYKAA